MNSDLYSLLLKDKHYVLDEGNKTKDVLFDSQASLSRAVMAEMEGAQNFASIRSAINRILKPGNDPNHRKMTPEFFKAIITVVEKRIHPEDIIADNIPEAISTAYDLLKAFETKDDTRLNAKDHEKFIDWSEAGDEAIVIIDDPGERHYETPQSGKAWVDEILSRLFRSLLRNLIEGEVFEDDRFNAKLDLLIKDLYQDSSRIVPLNVGGNEVYSIKFYLPSAELAFEQWLAIFRYFVFEKFIPWMEKVSQNGQDLTHEISGFHKFSEKTITKLLSSACDLFEILNQSQTDRLELRCLQMFTINPDRAYKPYLYIKKRPKTVNGIRVEKDEIAFDLELDKGKLELVSKWKGAYLEKWKEHFLRKLQLDPKSFGVHEVRFSDVSKEIRSEVHAELTRIKLEST